jgi:hypothetical protein
VTARIGRPAALTAKALRNLPASELVLAMLRFRPTIAQLAFKEYTPQPGAAERLRLRTSRDIEDFKGDELLARTKNSALLVRELLRHDPHKERGMFEVDARELLAERRLPATAERGRVLGLCSRCRLCDGRTMHIPLMDFRVTPTSQSARAAKRALRAMGEAQGALLASGRSYHYYGFRLLEEAQWLEFMCRAILAAPLTDTRYIAHRLLAGMGVLRLTATAAKPVVPWVVTTL